MPLVALKGMTALKDEIKLQSHLAALLRLENVGLFLGAGASGPAGGRTVKQIWGDFLRESKPSADWFLENEL
ncbi:MAG: hypothetical protein WAL95_21125 [Candidatus Acidiferrales bacterium]